MISLKKTWLAAFLSAALLAGSALSAPAAQTDVPAAAPAAAEASAAVPAGSYRPATQKLANMLAAEPQLRAWLEKSIALAAEINPDPQTNPAQTLEAYLDYVNWAEEAMPWAILPGVEKNHPGLYEQIDQSLNYFYFVNDQPLEELKGLGLYIPSIQYAEPYRTWLADFVRSYGDYLSRPESWKPEYLETVRRDSRFGLDAGVYEDPSNWKSFNDFFSRRLASPAKRPIAEPQEDAVVVSAGDAKPQGIWRIADDNRLEAREGAPVGQPDFVTIKSRRFESAAELLGPSRYREAFAGGYLTHEFLDVYDYHRFHFPVSGTVREVLHIPGDAALGGRVTWDPASKSYVLDASRPGWQMIETRALIVVDMGEHGLAAILPIGMSQICSVVLDPSVKPGAKVKKGDMLGMFLFGGSDIAILFQKDANFRLTAPEDEKGGWQHLLMGEAYGRLGR